MTDLIFENPPDIKRGRKTVWRERLAPASARPGEWARVWECAVPKRARSYAQALKRGRLTRPAGRWEFCTRTIDGRGVLYARFLGAA